MADEPDSARIHEFECSAKAADSPRGPRNRTASAHADVRTPPRFIAFVRAIAFLPALVSGACSIAHATGRDGGTRATRDAGTHQSRDAERNADAHSNGARLTSCPAAAPTDGQTCVVGLEGMSCLYPDQSSPSERAICVCSPIGARAYHWACGPYEFVGVGPVPPPDLAA